MPAATWTKVEVEQGYVVFDPTAQESVGRAYVPARQTLAGTFRLALARGEYGSLQVGVHVLGGGLRDVRLQLESDLEARVYRPIDEETKKQLLAYEYNPVPERLHGACLDEADAIAAIDSGSTSFFWLTLHAGTDAAPGRHRGSIRIRPGNAPATELELEVTVRPYVLQRPRIAYAPFFYVDWNPGGYPPHQALPPFAQTDEWIAAIFRDMAEHSHTSLIGLGYGVEGAGIDFSVIPPQDNRTFGTLLPLAQRAGLTSGDIPVIHMNHNLGAPESQGGLTTEQKNRAMDWYETERRQRGWPELADYGWDEPQYPNPALRRYYEPFRDVRMRLATAQSAPAAYGLGDVHDIWIVLGGQVTPEMAAEARRLGAEVWTYICAPFSHKPLHERYYAGLYVWANGLRGHTTWHYHGQGSYKLVWLRPGDGRPMPLVGWETRREGIDDYRYLQMLEDAIAARPDHPLAAEARQWLEELRARVTVDPHKVAPGSPFELDEFDRIRETAAIYVERLGPVDPDRIPPRPPTRLKDEAKRFRGKDAAACVAGLRSQQTEERRAAAWALFEMGAAAAPAVAALAELLGDPETRIPALRALEAIGPASSAAVEWLVPLLHHPDGFVRLGAVFALGATGAFPLEAMTLAVQDDYAPAAQVAGRMMATLGPAGLPALPVLIEMLAGPDWERQEPALKAIAGIGPQAAAAVPQILRHWQGRFPAYSYWIEPLAAIGPGAAEAIPMLEQFRAATDAEALRHRKVHGIDAEALSALFRIRRSPEDLQALVALIDGSSGPPAEASVALTKLEEMGPSAAAAGPAVRKLIAAGGLSDEVRKRLEAFLKAAGAGAE